MFILKRTPIYNYEIFKIDEEFYINTLSDYIQNTNKNEFFHFDPPCFSNINFNFTNNDQFVWPDENTKNEFTWFGENKENTENKNNDFTWFGENTKNTENKNNEFTWFGENTKNTENKNNEFTWFGENTKNTKNTENENIEKHNLPIIKNRYKYVGEWGIFKGKIHHWVRRKNAIDGYRKNRVNI